MPKAALIHVGTQETNTFSAYYKITPPLTSPHDGTELHYVLVISEYITPINPEHARHLTNIVVDGELVPYEDDDPIAFSSAYAAYRKEDGTFAIMGGQPLIEEEFGTHPLSHAEILDLLEVSL